IGDIGLLGCKVEKGDDMVEGYHIHLGGGWGQRQGIARLLFESIAFEEVKPLLTAIIGGYMAHRNDGESFVNFVSRHSDDELRSMVAVAT
ncbi:MAG: NirA family protein, partial [Rubripirellula sp.]